MYVYGCNTILTTSMKNRSDKEMIWAFSELTKNLKSHGIKAGFHIMDNGESTALNMTINSMKIKYQQVPPSNHRENNSEIAIQTFKNHFIAGMCSIDKDFHIQLWDRLLKQATIRLNLLRQSGTLPHLSAYTHTFEEIDYNFTLLAPPGTRVVIHNKPNDCASWSPHGKDGCYIGPEMEGYRWY